MIHSELFPGTATSFSHQTNNKLEKIRRIGWVAADDNVTEIEMPTFPSAPATFVRENMECGVRCQSCRDATFGFEAEIYDSTEAYLAKHEDE